MNKKRVPATVQLIGCQGETYLGVKVSFFDELNLQEKGVFLTVNQSHWLKESTQIKKKKNGKVKYDSLAKDYYLPQFIRENAMQNILNNVVS